MRGENTCSCGRTFPGTLDGAWAARQHADAEAHVLTGSASARRPAQRARAAAL